MFRGTVLPVLLLGAVLCSSCIPPPPQEGFPRRFNEETVMGESQAAGHMTIGVAGNAPPLSEPADGGAAGFTVALGTIVARTLRVEPRFVAAPSERLIEMVADGRLVMAFPVTPITEPRARNHTFTDPYLVTHQRLLVPAASEVRGVADLGDARVCEFLNPETGVELSDLAEEVELVSAGHPSRCVELLQAGRVDAVTAEDVYLDHMSARLDGVAAVVGDGLNTEGYGAVIKPGAGNFLQFVENVFVAAQEDGRWARAYERWVGAEAPPPPDITVEEAAALFPSELPEG